VIPASTSVHLDRALRLVAAAIAMGGTYAVSRQCRKPTGWMGRRIARAMNLSHASLTAWGLRHLDIQADARILDIGCGGGQTIRSLSAAAPSGYVAGVDYAPASVAVARANTADLIAAGRVSVERASVSQLPFPDATFDLVTAVETHYYWPHLVQDLREIRRVLKAGGRVVIIAETYRGRRMDWLFRPVMRLLLNATYLTLDGHRAVLTEAGFADVNVVADRSRGWMCAVGAATGGR